MPVVLAGCLVLLLGSWAGPQQVAVPAPPADQRGYCLALAKALPGEVQGHGHASITPVSPLTAAWASSPATVLRCGVRVPELLIQHPEADSVGVNGVNWLIDQRSDGDVLFTTIQRDANVEVLVPHGAYPNPTDPLPAISDAVSKTVPSQFPQ
ncbi:DUF3515 domain-containing protein [Kitasatospora sp. NPDC052896]|uniref:DUF3515 domain-containing protein n=1 Tax=Kitasatospora sp. NPDC052896 TaxID=3364061 RepID=UPI0037C55FB0